jgi:hypothetical protein
MRQYEIDHLPENHHKFEGKMKEYKKKLFHILHTRNLFYEMNEKHSIIICNLQIHRILTQDQLHELSHLSKGFISNYLGYLQNFVKLNKIKIPRTHQFLYSMPEPTATENYLGIKKGERLAKAYDNLIEFARTIQQKLQTTKMQKKPGAIFLHRRIEDYIRWSEAMKIVEDDQIKLEKIQKDHEKIQYFTRSIYPTKIELREEKFSKEVAQIEYELLDRLISYEMRENSDPLANINALFLTRGILSQLTLKTLTGYARSTISKCLKKMLLSQEIIKHRNNNPSIRGYHIYVQKSVTWAYLNYDLRYFARMQPFIPEIEKIQKELKTEASSYEHLIGYSEISAMAKALADHFHEIVQRKEKILWIKSLLPNLEVQKSKNLH